jgi:hypothetical protein
MARLHRFGEDRHGSVLVEYAITLPLFLVLLFGVIDFGQIYLRWILAEKATQIAARLAVVRPPACGGVPAINLRPALDAADVLFGTSCSDGNDVCAAPLAITCDGGSEPHPAAWLGGFSCNGAGATTGRSRRLRRTRGAPSRPAGRCSR